MRSLRSLSLLLGVISSLAVTGCTVGTLVPVSSDPDPKPLERESSETPAPSGSTPTPSGSVSGTGSPNVPPANSNASANVSLRVSGDCAPDFRDFIVATNVVSYDSLSVTNASAPMNGSFQIQLVSGKRDLSLSTLGRTQDRDVVNVTAGGVVYTNLCNSGAAGADGCSFDAPSKAWRNDPVAGRITARAYDPRTGTLDVTLDGVVLASTQGRGLCKLQGTVKATRLGR